MSILPQRIVNCMSVNDRKAYGLSLGKPAMGLTTDEAREKAKRKAEKQIQQEIYAYLKSVGVWFIINPPMHKRSQLPTGAPDFMFVWHRVPIAIEVKVWGEKPRKEQVERHDDMLRDGWRVYLATCIEDVQTILFKWNT